MRCLSAVLVLLLGYSTLVAVAAPVKQTPKSAPAGVASPAPAPAKSVYAAMSDAERFAIQSDLIWTGDYNGLIGAEFGDRAVAAVRAYQKRNGGKETGILNPDERVKLAQAAKSRQEQAGWRVVDDAASGVRLGLPQKLAPQAGQAKAGSHWQSVHGELQIETFRIAAPGTTLAGVFEDQKKEPAGRKVEYNVLRPDFFVVSGLQGLKKFYVRGQAKDNEVRGLTVLYDQAMEGTVDRIAVAMSSAFVAFPVQAAAAGPAPRPKAEYGTGLVVSTAGDIVTDGALLTDCAFIVVPGLGYAERIADDKTTALALLRVNGARNLAPITLSDGRAAGGEISLIGIADPEAQNGAGAVSTTHGRLLTSGGAMTIDPTPGGGFAGAAALDRDGNVAGLVGVHPSAATTVAGAQLVPAQEIARFLDAQNVATVSGRAGASDVKAAAVRVICVRK
jgi:hypothetical protein